MFKRKQSPTTESTTKKQKNKKDQVWHLVFLDALEAHKQSRFEDALSLFTRALSMQPDHLSILDGRSSCDERLGHYDRAMTDAKRMIQVAPQDARGYLRAGRLLTLQKQLKAAHKVYNAGLSQVSSEDKRYSSIKDLQTSIDRELAERLDFISILPFDVKAMIFAYMPFSRRLRCLQVSRGWRDFALRWGGMWRDLDFGDRKVGQVVVGRCLGYTQGRHVRRLALSSIEQTPMDKILKLVIDHDCQYLDTLELKSCHPSRDIFMRTLRLMGKHLSHLNMNDSWGVSLLDIFGEALGHCPDLKKLSIMNLHSVVEEDMDEVIAAREVHATQIQELSMSLENLSDHSLIRLLGYFPQLGRLELQTQTVRLDSFYQELTKHCPHLESLALNIHHGQALVQPTEKSSLRHFSVRATTLVSARHLALFMTSDRLETLILANCSAIGPTLTSVALVPGALTQLRTLYLTSTLDLNQEDLASILATCTQLRDLKITGSQGVTDDLIEHLPTKIKRIDFSLSMRLTGSGLRQLIKRQTSLEKLVVNNCMNIDYTSVAWAVEQVGKRVIECRQTIKRR